MIWFLGQAMIQLDHGVYTARWTTTAHPVLHRDPGTHRAGIAKALRDLADRVENGSAPIDDPLTTKEDYR